MILNTNYSIDVTFLTTSLRSNARLIRCCNNHYIFIYCFIFAEEYHFIRNNTLDFKFLILPITGKIRYCADKSRSQATNASDEEYLNATIKLLKYLNTTINDSLTLGGNDRNIKLVAYGDSHSQLGDCFILTRDSGSIYSVSKKVSTVSHSSIVLKNK
jgi:hypothetical protein